MAETVQIDPELLYPGDTIRFDFLIRSDSETRKAAALKSIKGTIYSDDRLDYQGSEETFPVDLETGESSHILSVYATVRKYRRDAPPEVQKAGIGPIAIYGLVATIAAAVIVWKADAIYKTYSVQRIVNSSESDEVKTAALETLEAKGQGTWLAGVSGAAGKVGVLAVGAWLLTRKWGSR